MAVNPYEQDVDFAILALQDPAFNKLCVEQFRPLSVVPRELTHPSLKTNGQLDFSDPKAVQQLTKSLLKRDFSIDIKLPDDRLCPPVPNRTTPMTLLAWSRVLTLVLGRAAYILFWAVRKDQDGVSLLLVLAFTLSSYIRPSLTVHEDIDDENLHYARENIVANNFQSRIRPLKTKPDGLLIPLAELGLDSIDFTICNPPFYSSASELLASAAAKSRPPHSACTGAEIEMVVPGGEVAFVSRMIDESVLLKKQVQWYTSMLGKASSISEVVERLKTVKVDNWAVTEFVQGQKTRRWAVGWSWGDMRPRQDVARNMASLPKHLLPFPCEYHFSVTHPSPGERLNTIMCQLDLQWQYQPHLSTGIGRAKNNVWSRAARRKQKNSMDEATSAKSDEKEDEDDDHAVLGFKIQMSAGDGGQAIQVRWLQGKDSVLFESFCGMLKRQMIA
ncbi:MAG: hypothetical protein Q9195_000463 [Heterodermia aff. obscurata]